VAGFRTIWAWYDPPLSGEVLYDHFGLSSFEGTSNAHEFAGAIGLNGWPSVEVDSTNVLDFLPSRSSTHMIQRTTILLSRVAPVAYSITAPVGYESYWDFL